MGIVLDDKRGCEYKDCSNLGEVCRRTIKSNGDIKVYRRRVCTTHKRDKYNLINWSSASECKKSGKFTICENCGWEGPCDVHRVLPGNQGGKYSKENSASLCPNCHRLFHRGMIEFRGYSVEINDNWK